VTMPLGSRPHSWAYAAILARPLASMAQIRSVLLLVAEFGVAKAWRAYRALGRITQSDSQVHTSGRNR
jgi:hypothetical protein